MKDISFQTQRFLIREYSEKDQKEFVTYQTDPNFTRYHNVDELGEEHAQSVFLKFITWRDSVPRLNYQFAVCLKDAHSLIGSCGVRMAGQPQGKASFGIELAHTYWGKYRYAIEIATSTINWAFDNLPLTALIADTAPENETVARLANRAGFVRTHQTNKDWWQLEKDDWVITNT